jgi:hypothetical protein
MRAALRVMRRWGSVPGAASWPDRFAFAQTYWSARDLPELRKD